MGKNIEETKHMGFAASCCLQPSRHVEQAALSPIYIVSITKAIWVVYRMYPISWHSHMTWHADLSDLNFVKFLRITLKHGVGKLPPRFLAEHDWFPLPVLFLVVHLYVIWYALEYNMQLSM